MRRRHRVHGEQIERRRAIDQHVGEVRLLRQRRFERRQRIAQAKGAIARLADFKLEAGEIERRRREIDSRGTAVCTIASRNAPRRSARRRSNSGGCAGRCRGRSRRCPADRGRRSARRSPIAASAVPRLIAVVVLPTPPFWLAIARMRAAAERRCEEGCRLREQVRRGLSGPGRSIMAADVPWFCGLRGLTARTGSSSRTTTICAFASVRLLSKLYSIFQYLAASVNSDATSCPFGNSPMAPLFNSGSASASSLGSGASARAVTTSMDSGGVGHKVFDPRAWTTAGAPVTCTASRRNVAFLLVLSTR